MVEDLDDLLTGEHFLGIAIDVGNLLLQTGKSLS